jgi:CHASE3 domain sensor protein
MDLLELKSLTDAELEAKILELREVIDKQREEMHAIHREISVRHEKTRYKAILASMTNDEIAKLQQYIKESGGVPSGEKVGTPGSH